MELAMQLVSKVKIVTEEKVQHLINYKAQSLITQA